MGRRLTRRATLALLVAALWLASACRPVGIDVLGVTLSEPQAAIVQGVLAKHRDLIVDVEIDRPTAYLTLWLERGGQRATAESRHEAPRLGLNQVRLPLVTPDGRALPRGRYTLVLAAFTRGHHRHGGSQYPFHYLTPRL